MSSQSPSSTVLAQLLGGLPELVMYDLDGTLVDSVPGIALAVDRALEELGASPAGEALVRTWVGGGQRLLVQQAINFAGMAPAQLDSAIKAFRKHYAHTADHNLALFPGVAETLAFFADHGVSQVVVTNKPIEFVPAMLEGLGIAHYFADQLGGECLATRKPDPLMLNTMLQRFSVRPDNAVMVGDSSNDLLAANAAEVPCLAVSYGYARGDDLSQYNPVWLGDNLAQLLAPN
ncbi:HAD family hydrolase [Halioxenophilus aromaticivorans]|uniref:phosphoglycolate phosphatase n=1 Tax=Halioxenophilus aromaticivorans TaxID=1306992 RepID=A0AAV3U9M0_9ALTE